MTPDTAHYQAVGLVRGIYSDKALHIRQGSYPAVGIRKAKWHLDVIENKPFRFLVYPRFDLKAETLKFQILAWSEFQNEEDEWKLAGLWQFIPQLRRPVLAIHRNEKHWEGDRLKSCYLPFVWKGDDSPRPWRFNPRGEKEDQGSPMFVACTATLDRRFPRFFMKDVILTLDEAPKRMRAPKTEKTIKKKPQRKIESGGGEFSKPTPTKTIQTPGEGVPLRVDDLTVDQVLRSSPAPAEVQGSAAVGSHPGKEATSTPEVAQDTAPSAVASGEEIAKSADSPTPEAV